MRTGCLSGGRARLPLFAHNQLDSRRRDVCPAVLPSSSPESESLLTVGAAGGAFIVVEDGVIAGGNQLPAGLLCLALMPDG